MMHMAIKGYEVVPFNRMSDDNQYNTLKAMLEYYKEHGLTEEIIKEVEVALFEIEQVNGEYIKRKIAILEKARKESTRLEIKELEKTRNALIANGTDPKEILPLQRRISELNKKLEQEN